MHNESTVEKNLVEQDQMASRGKRLINLAIDSLLFIPVIFALYMPFHLVASEVAISKFWELYTAQENIVLSGYASLFIYFLVFELTIGKMPAKFFTKTTVVSKTGKAASIPQKILRSIVKTFYPEAISMLFGKKSQYALHDILSSTKVVVIKSEI